MKKKNISVLKMFNKAHTILNPDDQPGNNVTIALALNFGQCSLASSPCFHLSSRGSPVSARAFLSYSLICPFSGAELI